jgi:predicted nuclease of restriction endonuclease-like (RecB) superfamily
MELSNLVEQINQIHDYFQKEAVQQVNTSLTIRNWLVGLRLYEYEQKGQDRAAYGTRLYKVIAKQLASIKGLSESRLYLCKDFYLGYPQIFLTVSRKFPSSQLLPQTTVLQSVSLQDETLEIPQNEGDLLVSRLSFSHFIEILKAETPLKRFFYETECIKNNWNLQELKRAIETLLFERTGLSIDKESVIQKIRQKTVLKVTDVMRNPYILVFLELKEAHEYSEKELETAIINHLQDFLIELGRGFCFEARQKRITFDNEHYFIDLVFYHRILRCHVLIDLKIGSFDHADAGQMNLYLNYYRENEMIEGDNPPVGIILCAQKNDALVHYATGNLSQQVFVSKYLVNLPKAEELKRFVEREQNYFKTKVQNKDKL